MNLFLSILAVCLLSAGVAVVLYALRLPSVPRNDRDGGRNTVLPRQVVRPFPPSYAERPSRSELRPPPIPRSAPPVSRSEASNSHAQALGQHRPPTPRELFEQDAQAGFDAQFAAIEDILEEVRDKFGRIDKTFGDRVLKNTGADVANHLMAKELLAALEKKRSLMLWYKERTDQDAKTAFDVGFGKMAVATSSVGSPSAETTVYMDLEEVEREFQRIVKSFQRRKTFYEAFFPRRER